MEKNDELLNFFSYVDVSVFLVMVNLAWKKVIVQNTRGFYAIKINFHARYTAAVFSLSKQALQYIMLIGTQLEMR